MRILLLCSAIAVGCAYGELCGICECGSKPRSCPVPNNSNTWFHNGVLKCSKGFYLKEIGVIDAFKNAITLNAEHLPMASATCEENGWRIDGFFLSGVQLTSFVCVPTPSNTGKCPPLIVQDRSVQYSEFDSQYSCWDSELEHIHVLTQDDDYSFAHYRGSKLQCVNSGKSFAWNLTGLDVRSTRTIDGGSTINCVPKYRALLPEPPSAIGNNKVGVRQDASLPLVPIGKTTEGLFRYACTDGTVTLVLETGKTTEATYIDFNNSIFRYYSSDNKASTAPKIIGVSCKDTGSKKDLCVSDR